MDNLHYLLAAFAAVWIVLFAYLARLNRRTGELGRQLAELELALRNKEDDLPDGQEAQAG
jgi:CcmD family protein